MQEPFEFTRQGRSLRNLWIVLAIYALLLAGIRTIDMAWWIALILALPTLPVLWDFWHNPKAGLMLGHDRIDWYTGRRKGSLRLSEIDHIRIDTRWDFSVRISAVLTDDTKIRLPYEAIPPHKELETQLDARNVHVIRHHFTIF